MIDLKERLKNNALTVGSWITIGHASIAEIMAGAGFDWLAVDMEHSAIELPQAQELIRTIELSSCVPLVRVGSNDKNIIKRVMDAGAHGVIVPMVNTVDDAINAVSAVKYPPAGTRGVGLARAQGYGLRFERYRGWVNKKSVVIAQIEHIEGVRNLEEILDVDGIDAIMVGPYDLSGSLGRPGEFDTPEMRRALKRIADICKKKKKVLGFHVIPPDAGAVKKKISEGYKFLAFSLDSLFLGRSCETAVKKLKAVSGR